MYRLHKVNGFTIVEVLVTLVLLSLVASVLAPGLNSWLSSRTAAAERQAIESVLASIPLQASVNHQRVVVRTSDDLALEQLTSQIAITRPIVVLENGYCMGGEFSINQDGRQYDYVVTAPFCQVSRADEQS